MKAVIIETKNTLAAITILGAGITFFQVLPLIIL